MRLSREKIMLIIARKGITTKEIATVYGCCEERARVIMRCKRPVRPDVAGRFAKALGVDVADILED